MKYTLLAFLAFITTASASFQLGSDGPGGFSVYHNGHWDHNGVHVDDPQPVPEPDSPVVLLAAAGVALLSRRARK